MKLKDLLNEVVVHQNNFIKIDMVEKELGLIFGEDAPKPAFDENGMYVKMDNFLYREIENNPMNSFTLTDAGFENEKDEIKNTRKYYVEYTKVDKVGNTNTEGETEKSSE